MLTEKMKHVVKLSFLAVVMTTMGACSNDDDQQPAEETVSYGAYVNVGDGQARSYIVRNPDGTPKELGFRFSEASLDGLPEHNASYKLPMPEDNETLINHISLDYSIHGHGPEGIYDAPHFDMHFYMLSEAQINTITLEDPKIDVLPAAEFVPQNYVPGANEPKMGKHWADTTAHEFHGADFTSTLIYGSYNGKFHFVEPMVAIGFLKTKPNVTLDIIQPAKVQQAGLYAKQYSIKWEKVDAAYRISLNALTLRQL